MVSKTKGSKSKQYAHGIAKGIGLICGIPIILPAWLCYCGYKSCKESYELSDLGMYRFHRRGLKLERKRWPKPLDQEKRIAIEEGSGKVSKATAKSEEKPGLFTLPYEIRVQIYQYVLGLDEYVHVTNVWEQPQIPDRACLIHWYSCEQPKVRAADPLFSTQHPHKIETSSKILEDVEDEIHLVKDRIASNWRCSCASRRNPTVKPQTPDYWKILDSFECMGLLLTCRQSYVDILTLIYTHKVFLISDISTLLTFSLSLPINHMNNIRSLHLTVEISGYGEFLPHHTMSNLPSSYRNLFPFLPPSGVSVDGSKKMYPYTWLAVCATLARMEGLRRLWIDIQFNYNPLSKLCDKPPEDLIFQPLMSIARVRVAGQLGELDVFKVLVNWKAGDTAWEEKGIPFVLKRELAVKRLPATAQVRRSSSLDSEMWVQWHLAGGDD